MTKDKIRLGVAGLVTTTILTLAVGFGLTTEADGSMWRNDRNTVKLFPTTLATELASTTASSMKVGATGTRQTGTWSGVCNIHSASNTISATTTATVDCQLGTGTQTALAGVPAWASGDRVFMTLSTTTPTTFMGLQIIGATGSTTAGFITLKLANWTGAEFTWTSTASTSLQYLYLR